MRVVNPLTPTVAIRVQL